MAVTAAQLAAETKARREQDVKLRDLIVKLTARVAELEAKLETPRAFQ